MTCCQDSSCIVSKPYQYLLSIFPVKVFMTLKVLLDDGKVSHLPDAFILSSFNVTFSLARAVAFVLSSSTYAAPAPLSSSPATYSLPIIKVLSVPLMMVTFDPSFQLYPLPLFLLLDRSVDIGCLLPAIPVQYTSSLLFRFLQRLRFDCS